MPETVYARISMAYALASAVLPENCRKDARSRVLVRGVQVRDFAMKLLRPIQAPTKVATNRCRVSVRSCAVTSGSRWDVAGWGFQVPQPRLTCGTWGAGTPPPRPRRRGAPRGGPVPRAPQCVRTVRERLMEKSVSGRGPSEYESAGLQLQKPKL